VFHGINFASVSHIHCSSNILSLYFIFNNWLVSSFFDLISAASAVFLGKYFRVLSRCTLEYRNCYYWDLQQRHWLGDSTFLPFKLIYYYWTTFTSGHCSRVISRYFIAFCISCIPFRACHALE